ncbi:MAG: hypothetical protein HKN71_12740 [Gemmatimonadetes bacterium]|nr:hypothetical protein [Gemmatimonadota bacterium]
MSERARSTWLAMLGVAVATAVAGFIAGNRWPLQAVGDLFRSSDAATSESPWTPYVTTDLPRYENLAIASGDSLFLLGGFIALDAEGNALATDRVEILNLRTGEFERRSPLPMPLTHGGGARVRDSIWVVGGFVGDHPGPTTDEVWVYSIVDDSWSAGPSLPVDRGGGQLVALGDTLHFFGGYLPDRNTGSTDHWRLVIGDSAWTPSADFPLPRGHFTQLRLDSGFLAIGGNIGHDPLPVDVPAVHWFDPSEATWVAGPELPFAISHTEPATAPYEGGAVMVGGRSRPTGRENLDDVLFLDSELGRWVHLGRLSVPFLGGTAGIFADTLVTGMGAETGNDPRNAQLWKRPLRNRWLRLDDLPHGIDGVGAAARNGTLYAVGNGTGRTLAYSIASGRWAPDEAVDTRPWAGGAAAVESWDGRIAVVGGRLGSAGQFQIFEPEAGEWRVGPTLPEPLAHVATAQVGGRLYALGGLADGTAVSSVYSIAPGEPAWTSHTPLPGPRSHAAAGSDGRRVFVFGGRDEAGAVTDDVQVYDPIEQRWTTTASGDWETMPEPRAEQGRAVFLDGEFWLIGGESDSGATRAVDLFNPETMTWRVGPELESPRAGGAPVLDGDRILLVGGRADSWEPTAKLDYIWPKR